MYFRADGKFIPHRIQREFAWHPRSLCIEFKFNPDRRQSLPTLNPKLFRAKLRLLRAESRVSLCRIQGHVALNSKSFHTEAKVNPRSLHTESIVSPLRIQVHPAQCAKKKPRPFRFECKSICAKSTATDGLLFWADSKTIPHRRQGCVQ